MDRAEIALQRIRSSSIGEIAWLLFIAGCFALHLSALVTALGYPERTDFAAFTENARAWLGGTPYPVAVKDPNTPHTILVFVAFSTLSAATGLLIWMLISYAALIWTLRIVVRELGIHLSAPLRLTALACVAAAPPMLDVVVNGNMIWPLGLLSTSAWILARRKKIVSSAAIVGVLATAKPLLGTFLLYWGVRRNWRAVLFLVTAGCITILASVVVTGTETWIAWFGAIRRLSAYGVPSNASVMGLLTRVWRPHILLWSATSLLIAAVTVLHLRKSPRDVDREWTFVFLASLLMAPLGWRYYLCLGLGPLAGVLMRSSLSRLTALTILLAAWSPSLHNDTWPPVLQATLGSIPFWLVLLAWLQLPREPLAREVSAA